MVPRLGSAWVQHGDGLGGVVSWYGQAGAAQMGSIARTQRDGPKAWIFPRMPSYNASEAVNGVVVLALDDDLGASVEPRWKPSSQTTVGSTKVFDGGLLRAEVPL